MRKIGLFCLCLAGLSLAGCFHIPDEDWLLSKNKVNTGSLQKDDEMDQALNDIMEGINMFSSDWNELKNKENNGTTTEEVENIEVETGNIQQYEEIIDNEVENDGIVENITPEE